MEADSVFMTEVALLEQVFQTYLTQYASVSQKAGIKENVQAEQILQRLQRGGKASALHSPVEILLH